MRMHRGCASLFPVSIAQESRTKFPRAPAASASAARTNAARIPPANPLFYSP